MYQKVFKRIFDFIAALIGLIIALPFILIIFILLAIANRGKAFFVQKRPGYKGRPFKVIKFKTMNDKKDSSGNLLPDGKRLTKVGRIVRKLSLDELPQLFNVLMGDLSLVGPRPLLMEYLPLYSEEQSRRHDVKPGITGWAQVNGRNLLSWEEKFELDVYYVDHISFGLDIKIIFKTVGKVFKAEGVSSETSPTMEKFKGTKAK